MQQPTASISMASASGSSSKRPTSPAAAWELTTASTPSTSAVALAEAWPISGIGDTPSAAARIELAEHRYRNPRARVVLLLQLDAQTGRSADRDRRLD